jgi:hypothetical protein
MSFRGALRAFALALFLIAPIAAKAQGDYLDVLIVKVKPEKLPEFQANSKRFAESNRRNNGDRWIALESVYGDSNVYIFNSTRASYADIEKANDAEFAAIEKSFGKGSFQKLLQDFNNTIVSARAELRRRRWDLSSKAPKDAEAYAKLIGESRLIRTTAVHIRPGHVPEFEALLKDVKEASEKNANAQPLFISQVVEGTKGSTFYVSTLRSSIGGFDNNPTLRDILGDDGFKKFQQISAESVELAESNLYRFNPEISNPPEEVAKVAVDFWRPKPAAATAAAKPKAAESPASASSTKPASKDAAKPQ